MEHILTGARRPWRRAVVALLGLVLTGLAAGAAPSPAAAADPVQEMDWTIGGSDVAVGEAVRAAPETYILHNRTNARHVRYGEREYGINLVWAAPSHTSDNIEFARQAGPGALQYNEPVAIRVLGGGYLRYQKRDYGINLVWSDTPVYEWRIRGAVGTVRASDTLSLFNTVRADAMVYAEREYGINLRWYTDVQADSATPYVAVGYQQDERSELPPFNCTGRVIWRLTPVSLTGTVGIATTVTADRDFDIPYRPVTAGRFACAITLSVKHLRPGTWRVAVVVPFSTSCEVTFRSWDEIERGQAVNFTNGVQGCSTDGSFPKAPAAARPNPGSLPDILLDPAPIAVADPTVPILVATEPPAATLTLSPSWPVLQPGAEGEAVTSLQYLLRHSGHDVAVDGTFSPGTAAAVAAFQQGLGLSGDGSVGAETWMALIVPVQRGSQGDAVRAVQRQLAARGVAISEDGHFGSQTEQAVQAYQQARGLTADGIVDPPTWQALVAGR